MAQQITVRPAGRGLLMGGGSFLGSIFKMIFLYWRWVITTIIISVLLVNAITESVEQNSPLPLFQEIGGRVVAADVNIDNRVTQVVTGEYTVEAGDQKILWNRIKFQFAKYYILFDLFASVWFIYIMFKVFFWLALLWNDSARAQSFFTALLVLVGLEMITSVILYTIGLAGQQAPPATQLLADLGYQLIPFRGLVRLFIYFPTILDTVVTMKPVDFIEAGNITSGTMGGIDAPNVENMTNNLLNQSAEWLSNLTNSTI